MFDFVSCYKEIKVWSATKLNLIATIIHGILIGVCGSSIVRMIFNPFEGCGIVIISLLFIVIPLIGLFLFNNIQAYNRRRKFTLYFCRIEHIRDITKLKSEVSICKLDTYGVLFVKKENVLYYSDWESAHGVTHTKQIDSKYFKDASVSYTTKRI